MTSKLVKQDWPAPVEAERRGLEHCIEQDSDRSDSRRRLCLSLLQQQEHLIEIDINHAFLKCIGAGQTNTFLAPLYHLAHRDGAADYLDLPTCV